MDNIDQVLADLGDGATLLIMVDGREMKGYIYEQISGARFEWLSVAVPSSHGLNILIGTLDSQALELLCEWDRP